MKGRTRGQNAKLIQDERFTSVDYDNGERKLDRAPIPPNLLNKAYAIIGQKVDSVPFKDREIKITCELIKNTMEILNAEPTKTLPQNCRKSVRRETPDGLDKRLKKSLNSDTMMANIISDVLAKASIAEIVRVPSYRSDRRIKGTTLLPEWSWSSSL